MQKILVANRGEIACRIIRSIHDMGFQSVAIYSEADRNAKHVRMAHESYLIGPAPSKDSYLRMDKIIDLSKKIGVTMIHPGYGFLSENAEFAVALKDAGITFIGPGVHAIKTMGSKLAAKAAVSAYDIPMVPGTEEAVENVEDAVEIANKIGFPILIKASAGGGGKGMRLVEDQSDVKDQMQMAISEAVNAFGDGSVFIEKFVTNPRHIEIQVLADNHGNVIHLNERECSIQRRHQKVVEEAPSAILTEDLRQRMGQAAIDVAKACDYSGAGTVEFLVDDKHNFYFLEMNTRLQVEHPVTELITGIDLVEQQIKVALNETLKINQRDIGIQGHALELRVYAEDPMNDFLPDIGTITKYVPPTQDFVRLDDSFIEGDTIPIYYDPMIAKLIVYGKDRADAMDKMKKAITAYQIEGVKTTLDFGHFVMDHPAFRNGDFDTNFVKYYFSAEKMKNHEEDNFKAAAALLAHLKHDKSKSIVIAE
jgi:propionyl-CoA carboxylase alpha chain